MLGYVCKYTPMELFEAMDTEITRLEPSVTDFNHADTLMHANICSYTKAVLEDVMEHDYEGVILTTCCDSIRRLYDTLKSQFPDKFFFLLDIPRKFNDFAVTLYERQLKQMLTEYEAFSGKTLDLKRFVSMMQNKAALKKPENTRMSASAASEKGNGQKLNIGIMGARCNNEIRQLLVDRGANLLFDLTCTGLARDFSITEDQVLHSYAAALLNQIQMIKRKGDTVYTLGIDSGSTSTNAVILDENRQIKAFSVVRTGAKSSQSADAALADVLKKAGLDREDISLIVSTGYGRVSIPFADKNVTEISCHGKGAHLLFPDVHTILDIGGQDSKAIRLNDNGEVADFVMNDKCAAGTGRFLEMMARSLEISIDELGPVSLQSKENIEISSMCSVFAESEVISLIAQNKEIADIAHGIHKAIAGKAMSLLKRVGLNPGYMMTGGVAKNPGVVAVLEEQLGEKLHIYEEPEIVGALGAALYGLEEIL